MGLIWGGRAGIGERGRRGFDFLVGFGYGVKRKRGREGVTNQ